MTHCSCRRPSCRTCNPRRASGYRSPFPSAGGSSSGPLVEIESDGDINVGGVEIYDADDGFAAPGEDL